MKEFKFSTIQAQAILDMRLQKLTGLEIDKVKADYDELQKLILRLQEILDSKELRMDIIKNELIAVKEKYGENAIHNPKANWNEEKEKDNIVKKEFSNKINPTLSRYKGLGEMPADQLKSTTMHPEKRKLLSININQGKKELKERIDLDNLLLGNTRRVDVADCNGKPMILLCGLGFEAGMVDKASRELKNIFGPMAYVFSGAKQMFDQKPFNATLRIDESTYQLQASAITVANAAPATSVMAQGFGQVIPDDGLMEVIVATPKDRASGLSVLSSLAWSALNNNTSQNDNLACFRTKQIEVELEETQKLVVDGEILDTSKVTVSINPGALQVVTPIRLKP